MSKILSALRSPIARAVLAAAAACPGLAAAVPVTVNVDIDTLPPGLVVGVGILRDICQPGLVPITQAIGSIPALTETSQTVFDVVSGPTGLIVRTRVVTHYTGQFVNADATPSQAAQRCGSDVMRFNVGVNGVRPNGTPAMRIAERVQIEVNPVSAVRLSPDMRPATTGNVPSDISRGASQTLVFTDRNVFFDTSTVSPTLQFRKPALIVGQPSSILASVTIQPDGHKCISAGGIRRCDSDTALVNGELVHGGIALHVHDTARSAGTNPQFGNVQYRFRLTSEFASGNLELRAFADDLDPFDYIVDGQAQPLDLVPWKSFVAPVVVH